MSTTHASPKAWDESIAELTRQGETAREIARRLGVTTRTVSRARKRTGTDQPCSPNAGRRYSTEFLSTVERHLDEGWSYKEIARTYRVSEDHIANHFPGRGWTREQAAELAVARKAEIRLFRVLDNQCRNARHLMPMADVA